MHPSKYVKCDSNGYHVMHVQCLSFIYSQSGKSFVVCSKHENNAK